MRIEPALRYRQWISLLAILAGISVSSAYGIPPLNDNCANASLLIGSNSRVTLNTTEATLEEGEPKPSCVPSHGHSVWFKYTPASDGMLFISTKNSPEDYDTVLALYTGSCGLLAPVACADESIEGVLRAEMSVPVTGGVMYTLQVSSYGSYPGEQLVLDYAFGPPPMTIEQARSLPVGSQVTLLDLCASMTGNGFTFFVATDRSAAIMVSSATIDYGSTVTVTGVTYWDTAFGAANCNLAVQQTGLVVTAYNGNPGPKPVGMSNKTLGGLSQGNQPGVAGGTGPCNQGQFVRTWGTVTSVNVIDRIFTIDDGSNIPYNPTEQIYGVRVWRPVGNLPQVDEFATVSGSVWIVPDLIDANSLRPMVWELP